MPKHKTPAELIVEIKSIPAGQKFLHDEDEIISQFSSHPTLAEGWSKCTHSGVMLWYLQWQMRVDTEVLVTLACDFAEHVLPVYEAIRPADRRPHEVIKTARLDPSRPMPAYLSPPVAGSSTPVDHAADAAVLCAGFSKFGRSACSFVAHAARSARWSEANQAIESAWQCDRIRELVGNPFLP